jgi:quercetin dioxygenase-like cupin family protein
MATGSDDKAAISSFVTDKEIEALLLTEQWKLAGQAIARLADTERFRVSLVCYAKGVSFAARIPMEGPVILHVLQGVLHVHSGDWEQFVERGGLVIFKQAPAEHEITALEGSAFLMLVIK